jgi:hypothetical protein
MNSYIHLLISVVHPTCEMTINRYCVGIDANDPLYAAIDVDRWAAPEMRARLLSLLCEDWLTDDCCVVACEPIAGAVQWQRAAVP